MRTACTRPAGALTAALNYYRALVRTELRRRLLDIGERDERTQQTVVPTLVIWGERDRALGIELTKGLGQWVSDVHVERLPEASHWVQNDAPQRVNDLLLDFLLEAA